LHEWKAGWEPQAFCLEITGLVIRYKSEAFADMAMARTRFQGLLLLTVNQVHFMC